MSERRVTILAPGLFASVQDGGRFGARASGVGVAGALDPLALVTANRMAGNDPDAAAIECTLGGARIRIEAPMRVALAGAECDARIDGVRLPAWSCAFAEAGSVLALGAAREGTRTIVAFGGGIDVPRVLGSRSTDLAAGFGGFAGRALRAGDELPIGPSAASARAAFRLQPPEWSVHLSSSETGAVRVRALVGPESARVADARSFWEREWEIAPQSNRMGYRLAGAPLAAPRDGAMRSHAVEPGVVQLPPNGVPIVLLADAQTTGGYPRIAIVIEADRRRAAQARIGGRLRFVRTDFDEAKAARHDVEAYLRATAAAIAAQLQ